MAKFKIKLNILVALRKTGTHKKRVLGNLQEKELEFD